MICVLIEHWLEMQEIEYRESHEDDILHISYWKIEVFFNKINHLQKA